MGSITSLSTLRGLERANAALAILLRESPLFRYLEQHSAFKLAATNDVFQPVNATGSIQGRKVGGGYEAALITPEAQVPTKLYFHGGAIAIDESHIADSEKGLSNIKAYLDERVPEELLNFIIAYEALLMKGSGTGDPEELKGLLTILNGVNDLPGFTDVKAVINAEEYLGGGATSFDLTNTANYKKFVKFLRLWKAKVPNANGMLMSPTMHATMCAIADELHALGETRDRFGNAVQTFDNVPLIPLLDTSILHNEPNAAEAPVNETTSIYIANAGETALALETNSGLDYKAYDLNATEKKAGAEEWEIRSAWRAKRKNCILRVRRIKV